MKTSVKPGETGKASADEQETHVGRLIRKHANGRSLREMERQHGLSNGYLARYTRTDWDRRQLNTAVLHRFTEALGASMEEVTEAFALDMALPLTGRSLSPGEVDLLDCYAALSPEGRVALAAVAEALVEKFPAKPRAAAT